MSQGWTVLFFIYEEVDKLTVKYANELIGKLTDTVASDDLTLLVFESIYRDNVVDSVDGKLYELKHKDGSAKREKILEKDFGNINPGDFNTLKRVLEHVKDNDLLREKFLLFTWDHGLGFGIFDGDPVQTAVAAADVTNAIHGDAATAIAPSSFRIVTNGRRRQRNHAPAAAPPGAPVADTNGDAQIDMLTNRELSAALATLGRKTNLVIMMNCWMQMLETSYELAENVDYLVAAETVHFFAGYDYKTIIDEMATKPAISAEEVAELTVRTTQNTFRLPPFATHLDEIIISTASLGKLKYVKAAMEKIWEEMIGHVDKKFININATRKVCRDLSQGYLTNTQEQPDLMYFIDFKNYILELNKKRIISAEALKQFETAFSEYIIHTYIGDRFVKINPRTNVAFGHGVSIFHPFSQEHFEDRYFVVFYEKEGTSMAKSPWGNFLKAYQRIVLSKLLPGFVQERLTLPVPETTMEESGFGFRLRLKLFVE